MIFHQNSEGGEAQMGDEPKAPIPTEPIVDDDPQQPVPEDEPLTNKPPPLVEIKDELSTADQLIVESPVQRVISSSNGEASEEQVVTES